MDQLAVPEAVTVNRHSNTQKVIAQHKNPLQLLHQTTMNFEICIIFFYLSWLY